MFYVKLYRMSQVALASGLSYDMSMSAGFWRYIFEREYPAWISVAVINITGNFSPGIAEFFCYFWILQINNLDLFHGISVFRKEKQAFDLKVSCLFLFSHN